MPYVMVTVTKIALRWHSKKRSILLILLFTQYEATWLTAIGSHCLVALPAKFFVFNSHMQCWYSVVMEKY